MSAEGNVPGWQQISSTRLNVYERCHRQYYFRYRRWAAEEARPILFFGRAVEEAILRTFEAMPPAEVATSLDGLLGWAAEHAAGEVPGALGRARAQWESDPNRMGVWEDDIVVERGQEMARRCFAPAFHGAQVQACLSHAGGNLLGAWALARPRHARTDEDTFASHIRVPPGPDAWFSGAYDLWYVHSGRSVIVDLKSSTKGSIFSTQYPQQLAAYCWIHRETEGRLPDAIELWYLAEDKPEPVPLPTDLAIADYIARAHALFLASAADDDREENYAAEPAPLAAGRSWCDFCSFRALCPRTRDQHAPAPGASPLAAARVDRQFVTVRGTVAAIRAAKSNDRGTRFQRLVIADTSGFREVTFFGDAIDQHLSGLRRGQMLTLENVRVSIFRNTPGLTIDWSTKVKIDGAG